MKNPLRSPPTVSIALSVDPEHVSSDDAKWEYGHGNLWNAFKHPTILEAVNNSDKTVVQHYAFFTDPPYNDRVKGGAHRGTVCLPESCTQNVLK